MLSPEDRTLLVDLLAAPDGFRLDAAVATTFTLDLTALLQVPLAFAGADLSAGVDPLTVLQAIRQHADRIDVFCQAGCITVPSKPNDLLSFLESMTHQIERPRPGRLFHPKLWVLRFSGLDEPTDRVFRLVCGSRNLTNDRAWDAVITLDGAPRGLRRRAVNNPLVDFVSSLPDRARGMPEARRARVIDLAESLRTVEWEAPPEVPLDADWLRFHSFGRVRSPRPDLTGHHHLVVSPFINDAGINALFEADTDLTVVSRAEELDQLSPETREWFTACDTKCFVLDDDAAIPPIDDEAAGRQWSLTGLHAKTYVVERGHRAHVFIGSANATDAAWGGNDEFLVELIGKRNAFGVASMTSTAGFGGLLTPYELGDPRPPDLDEELRWKLENALRDLASLDFIATLTGSDDAGWSERLDSPEPFNWNVEGAQLTASLVTIAHDTRSVANTKRLTETWKLDNLEDATPFIVLRLTAGKVEASTVVVARLIDDPADRLDRVLARQFTDAGAFLRFLTMLLSLVHGGDGLADLSLFAAGGAASSWTSSGSGLLEAMMHALAVSPATLDDIAHLVDRLRETDEGRAILPEGWDDLWDAMTEARSRIQPS